MIQLRSSLLPFSSSCQTPIPPLWDGLQVLRAELFFQQVTEIFVRVTASFPAAPSDL